MSEFPARISHAEALAIIERAAAAHRLPAERIAVRHADARILAADVAAPIALPPFDNSAMDGFAFRHVDLARAGETRLRLAGERFAGDGPGAPVGAGECVRITTGAVLPAGADTVVPKENALEADATVLIPAGIAAGTHVRRAGEDVGRGERVLQAGAALAPSRLALAAALGLAELEVSQRPTVAVFATGDELVEPGLPLAPGRIYNSNRAWLMSQLRLEGLEPTAWPTLPDDPARLSSMLRDAASAFDVVITSGGVSAGEKDHLPQLLRHEGEILFWRVRMKPGMPLLFGRLDRALVLALPGNPVSTLATFLTLGRALLDGMQGRREARNRWHARLAAPWRKRHQRHEFLRGRLSCGDDATLRVLPNPADGSHHLRGAADSDALIVLPEGERDYAAGDIVEVIAY